MMLKLFCAMPCSQNRFHADLNDTTNIFTSKENKSSAFWA